MRALAYTFGHFQITTNLEVREGISTLTVEMFHGCVLYRTPKFLQHRNVIRLSLLGNQQLKNVLLSER